MNVPEMLCNVYLSYPVFPWNGVEFIFKRVHLSESTRMHSSGIVALFGLILFEEYEQSWFRNHGSVQLESMKAY